MTEASKNEARTNPVVEAILRRRSVRKGFAAAEVPQDVVRDVIRCGLAAPSSKNGRPWRFHVVTDQQLLHELATVVENSEGIETYVPFSAETGRPKPGLRSSVIESAAALRSAPLAIFVEGTGVFSGGRPAVLRATPENLAASIVGFTFEIMGIGAAVQNMWIAAVSHGLCCVYLGDIVIAECAINRRLGIARDLMGALVLGYADIPRPRGRSEEPSQTARVTWRP